MTCSLTHTFVYGLQLNVYHFILLADYRIPFHMACSLTHTFVYGLKLNVYHFILLAD